MHRVLRARAGEAIRRFLDAGFEEVVLVHIGDGQDGFFRFREEELAPRLRES